MLVLISRGSNFKKPIFFSQAFGIPTVKNTHRYSNFKSHPKTETVLCFASPCKKIFNVYPNRAVTALLKSC